jgi:RNA polymerase sigma-70 factor (ECF subfamily)
MRYVLLFCGTPEDLAAFDGPAAALSELDAVAGQLAGYHLLHAVRGRLLHDLGDEEQTLAEQLRAAQLTANPAEQALL